VVKFLMVLCLVLIIVITFLPKEDKFKEQLLDRGLSLGGCARLKRTKTKGVLIGAVGFGYVEFQHWDNTIIHHHLNDLKPCGE